MCQHLKFNAQVHVHRIVEDNRLTFNAELAVRCGECGEVFEFIGMQTGISQTQPTTGINGTTARLPIAPARLKQQDQIPSAERPMVPGVRQGRVRKSVDDVPRPPRPVQVEATPSAVMVRPVLDITDVALSDIAGNIERNQPTAPTFEPMVKVTESEPAIEQAPEPHTPAPESPSSPTE